MGGRSGAADRDDGGDHLQILPCNPVSPQHAAAGVGDSPRQTSGVNVAPGPLDVAAAWREDRSALTIAVVNPTEYFAQSVRNALVVPSALQLSPLVVRRTSTGVVADSVPAREFTETQNKAMALLAAVRAAEAMGS